MLLHIRYPQWNGYVRNPSALLGIQYFRVGKGTFFLQKQITAWSKCREFTYHPSISIGRNCRFGRVCHITAIGEIIIGDNLLTGQYVIISDNAHGESTKEQLAIPLRKENLQPKAQYISETMYG